MAKNKSKIEISTEEVISLLKKTSIPTILVEGCDDMIVYRAIEQKLEHLGVSILPVGGRVRVLEVFSRKNEIPESVKIAFIADKDVWVNIGIPGEYIDDQLIFTDGYSIENDIFLDGELWRLLRGGELEKFNSELNDFVEWYALALARYIFNRDEKISLHPEHVLDQGQRQELLALRDGECYPDDLKNKLILNYARLVRGKSLISLLIRNTNGKGREPHHTDKALLESVAIRPGLLLNKISNKIEFVISEKLNI